MRFQRLIPILLLLCDACVDKLDLPAVDSQPRIVVDGLLTDQPGTHSVRLFLSSPLDSKLDKVVPITDASVVLADHSGKEIALEYNGSGEYVLADFQGTVGESYQLRFTTADGNVFESSAQILNPAGEITDLRYEFFENAINHDDLAASHDVFKIYIDSKNASGYPGLFRWRWTSVYAAKTFPELHKKPIPGSNPPAFLFDPYPCSGYVPVNGGTSMTQVGPCECCICYVTSYSEKSIVSNNRIAAQPEFKNVQVSQVPIDWKKFQEKFYIELEQLNLSEDVYEFWKNVQAQQEGIENIFQPNAIRVRGNVRCVTNPNIEVAGVFSVAGSTKREMFIKRIDVPRTLWPDTLISDCRISYPGSTNIKPLFW